MLVLLLAWLLARQLLSRVLLVEEPEWFGIRELLFHVQLLQLALLFLRPLAPFGLLAAPQEPFLRLCEPSRRRPLLLRLLALRPLWQRRLLRPLLVRALLLLWQQVLQSVWLFRLLRLLAWPVALPP